MPAEMQYHPRYRYRMRYQDSDDHSDPDSLRV